MIAFRYLVSDVEQAKSFYVGLLGSKLVKQWGPAFAEVELGGVSVWLSGPRRPRPNPCRTAGSPRLAAGTALSWS